MAGQADNSFSDDELLVALIDRELDAEARSRLEDRLANEADLRARIEGLKRGGRRFREAFDAVLAAAPVEDMQARLPGAQTRAPRQLRRRAFVAAAIAIFAGGAAVGYLVPPVLFGPGQEQAGSQRNWRQAVAGYQAFLTSESMEVIADDPASIAAELAAVGAKLSLDLSADRLAMDHAYLKRVQLFDYRDRPLVQLAYLSHDQGPISFCIIASGRPDEAVDFEEREGFNIVYWTKAGRGYLLIGHAPRETLEAMAGELASRVG